jgi:hypothetical protein
MQVYSSSIADSLKLRNGRSGFLLTSVFNNQQFPPFDTANCQNAQNCNANFNTGDVRANLFIGLASMHTLFVREHNRYGIVFAFVYALQYTELQTHCNNRIPPGTVIDCITRRERSLVLLRRCVINK